MSKKSTILITGGRGFIGKNIILSTKKKYNLIILSSKSKKSKSGIIYLNYNIIDDLLKLKKIQINYFVNCHGKIENSSFIKIYQDHYLITYKILQYINKKKLLRIIHLGSIDECGHNILDSENKIKERPESVYGFIKMMVTKLIIQYANKNKINFNIFRLFLIYGSGQKKPRLIPYLLDCIKKKKIAIINDSEAIKSFTHINTLSQIINLSLENKIPNKIAYVSSKNKISVIKLIKYLHKKYGLMFKLNKKEKPKSQFLTNSNIYKYYRNHEKNFFKQLDLLVNEYVNK